jgi:transmembrane sensor
MNKDILKRYFEGRSSRWEKKQVKDYFLGDDMSVFDEYIKENEKYADDVDTHQTVKEKFFDELMVRIEQQEHPQPQMKRSNTAIYLRIAASLLIMVGLSTLLFRMYFKQNELAHTSDYENITNVTRSLQYAVLSDSTKIWLNPGTTVSYNNKLFNISTRDVKITGEAFFDVAHNPQKPFRVHAGELTTTVLGTAFNVEAYSKEHQIRVLLVRGHVRVSDGISRHQMIPGQIMEYDLRGRNMNISHVDISDKQDLFTSGKIVFENVPLKDVINRLEVVFGLSFRIKNPELLKNKMVSGNYYRANPEEALHSILFMHGLHFKKKGEKEYLIY